MNKFVYATIFLFSFLSWDDLYANCPGCVIDVPAGLATDTLYLGDVPDGNANAAYDQDVSFRMPMSTTPVNANDPSIPAGLNITAISIVNITNLPPGLAWETNATSYDPQDETDGCIKFCGTPLVPGLYVMEVTVEATIVIVSQEVTFPMEILILPGNSTNSGFSLANNAGCGTVTTSFENNVPSNDQDGFSYAWDFGNGNSSIDENPADQTYTDPGVYVVNYEAVVDTVGYILTRVGVNEVSCFDIPTLGNPSNNPDMHLEIRDPSGTLIYESEAIDNTDAPVEYFTNIEIADGTYQLKVIDGDSGINGGDDICAEINFNLLSNGTITNDDFELELDILHPVDTIVTSDTVFVYENPNTPVVFNSGADAFCSGEMVNLTSSYDINNQWFFDGELIEGETDSIFEVFESGIYQVMYTSTNGCTALSEETIITIFENPETPEYENTNNQLDLLTTIIYDPNTTLQWYQDGVELTGETSSTYCALEDGTYTLEVTDLTTGCTSTFSDAIDYDETLNCATSTADFANEIDLKIYPNPVDDWINVSLNIPEASTIEIRFYDMLGRLQSNEVVTREVYGNTILQPLLVDKLPSGMHFIELRLGEQRIVQKFVKN